MRCPKATLRRSGVKMMTVPIKLHLGLYEVAAILARDAYIAGDDEVFLPLKTRKEAWSDILNYLPTHGLGCDLWDGVDAKIEAAAYIRARELFPELDDTP